jgi:glycosyltransferase involved in cell wall biosynthesis
VKVVVVSGIWPPDVGGPASHAPALAEALLAAGHAVEVVTTAAAAPEARAYRIRWVSRTRPAPLRHLAVVREVARAARDADRVYATSMVRRTALGAALARRPLVVKLVADEAFERAVRAGRFPGTLEDFQRVSGGPRLRLLRAGRNRALRRAAHVVVPSAYLRDLAVGWGVDAGRLEVVPNPAPSLPALPARDDARAELGLNGFTLATAGRLTRQKALGDALEAVARVDGVSLVVAGDGPERQVLEHRAAALGVAERVRFVGPLSRDQVLTLYRASDAALSTSAWENLPHSVVEALAVGTPVLATAVGGVPEVVHDGENGLLVPAGDVEAIAGAIGRLVGDGGLRAALASRAAGSVAELAEPAALERIVRILEEAGR